MTIKEDVLSNIVETELIDFAREMLRIEGPEPEREIYEEEFVNFLSSKMDKMGFEVEVMEGAKGRPSVVGILRGKGKGPNIMYNGHLDAYRVDPWTVNPYAGVIQDGNLYGVGAVDMKGQIASMTMAAYAIKKSGVQLDGDIVLGWGAYSSPTPPKYLEGAGTRGTKHIVEQLIKRNFKIDMGVVGEPTGLDLVLAQRGAVWGEISTEGISGLTGNENTLNAICLMVPVIQEVIEYDKELATRKHPLCKRANISTNMIEGGKDGVFYTVPNRCRILFDRRLIPGENTKTVVAELGQIVNRLKEKGLNINLKATNRYEPVETSSKEKIVKIALETVEEVTGSKPKIIGLYGFTEAMHLINAGIPTIVCGPGSFAQAHIPDEYISIDQLVNGTRIHALIALKANGKA